MNQPEKHSNAFFAFTEKSIKALSRQIDKKLDDLVCNEPWITIVGNLSVKVTDPMPQNVSDESS